MPRRGLPSHVIALRRGLQAALRTRHPDGGRVGAYQFGVYAFYDYDGEPIYVGQTRERLGARIGRHLTNQRTDAVAMNVLDPFEVAEIEMWPVLTRGGARAGKGLGARLDALEYTIYQRLRKRSRFGAVLNEKVPARRKMVRPPPSIRQSIVPAAVREERGHPDVRIARRASTIAALAKVVSERQVSPGLRQTLVTQAKRLAHLASRRLDEVE